MRSKDIIESLIDDSKWKGGWYQDITFPNGDRTISTTVDFDKHETRSLRKWDLVEPYLTGGKFLDIGCNAGGYFPKAAEKYDELYGIDSSEHFLKQAEYVLRRFKTDVKLFCSPALEFDFGQIPHIDTTIMINTLYWIHYSDEKKYVPDHEKQLHDFMDRLKDATTDFITVGMQGLKRIGGDLELTKDFLADHWEILDTAVSNKFNDRPLNVIYARSPNKPDSQEVEPEEGFESLEAVS